MRSHEERLFIINESNHYGKHKGYLAQTHLKLSGLSKRTVDSANR